MTSPMVADGAIGLGSGSLAYIVVELSHRSTSQVQLYIQAVVVVGAAVVVVGAAVVVVNPLQLQSL